jgi:hypothetical protein
LNNINTTTQEARVATPPNRVHRPLEFDPGSVFELNVCVLEVEVDEKSGDQRNSTTNRYPKNVSHMHCTTNIVAIVAWQSYEAIGAARATSAGCPSSRAAILGSTSSVS